MRIIITEKQLKEVLGANMAYLNPNDNNIPKGDYDSQISTSDEMDDDTPIPTMGDRISKSRCPRSYFGARKRHAPVNCSTLKKKESINETNQDLVNKTYAIPDDIMKILQSNLNNNQNRKKVDGIMRLKNLINMRSISTGEMYRLKNYFNNADKKSDEYTLLGGEKMKRWVEQQLNTATSMSQTSKQTKKELGFKNAFIKTHNKTGHGTAHSTKNNVTFNYEN